MAKGSAKSQYSVAAAPVSHDPIADGILRALRRILRKTAEHSRQLSRDAGLSVPQLICLRKIGEAPEDRSITAAELAEWIQLSTATISRILDRLDSLKLITRERDTVDRRKVNLRLTREGRHRVKSLPIPLQERFLNQLDQLPERQQRELLKNLESLVEMMGATSLDVAPMLTGEVEVVTSRR